jgi:DNA-binding transcriptional regulator YiaG
MRARRNQAVAYPESGIPNLWLKGMTVYRCRKCGGEYPEFPNMRQLHRGIADWLAQGLLPLTGPQFRFLRKQLGLSTRVLAAIMGVRRESVTRWETEAEPIGPTSERLMRLLYGVRRTTEHGGQLPTHLEKIQDVLASIQRKAERRPEKVVISPAALTAR